MPYTSQSFLTIDTFTIYDLFFFAPGEPIQAVSENRAYTGPLHVSVRWFRDTFAITFPKLEAAEMYQLNQICQQTGVNSLHTLIYGGYGPSGANQTRKYDGATAYTPGTGINDDVARQRAKIRIKKFSFPHWPGFSNIYTGIIEGEEA